MKSSALRFSSGSLLLLGGLCALMTWAHYADLRGVSGVWDRPYLIGHLTGTYGTVTKTRFESREPSQDSRRVEVREGQFLPLRAGEELQTAERSATEILLLGGSRLRLTPGSIFRFEVRKEEVLFRLVAGEAFLQVPSGSAGLRGFAFRKGDGPVQGLPSGTDLALALSTLRPRATAVAVRLVEPSGRSPDRIENELKTLALGSDPATEPSELVPPLKDRFGDGFKVARLGQAKSALGEPKVKFPSNDAEVGVKNAEVAFAWNPVSGSKEDPVVAYEVQVRPAFGYEVEEGARKNQKFKTAALSFPLSRVNGGGVFLWSVRAVTAGGHRSPASGTRWVELVFPKTLFAPVLMKPKVE